MKNHSATIRVASQAVKILKPESHPTPWIWMAITGFASVFPLLLGYMRNDIAFAIYGGLTGYLLGLIDQPGPWRRRAFVATIALFGFGVAFSVGIWMQNQLQVLIACSFLAIYFLGLMGGKGAEYERLFLFAMIEFFVASFARSITFILLPKVAIYMLVSFLAMLVGIFFSRLLIWESSENFIRFRQAFSLFFTKNSSRHFFSLHFAIAVTFALFCVDFFQITRGYWTVITVLLVMKPNRRETMYRLFQRLVGTITGVFIAELLVRMQLSLPMLILGASICATLVPYCWKRNYWLVTFFATNFVILLLSMAQYGHIDGKLTFYRLLASLYGCGIGILALALFRALEMVFPKMLFSERTT